MWTAQSQTVEEAISFVRDKFADMGNDLALVENKLISELGSLYGTDVFNLHGRCQGIQSEINKMGSSLEELYGARQSLMSTIEDQMKMSASLKNIEKMLSPHVKVNEDMQLLELLATHYRDIWNGTETPADYQEDVEVTRVLTPLSSIGTIEVTPTKPEAPTPEVVFKPISQKQFDEIPALVKRRAKLEQVNELYKYLFDTAVERKRCLPLKFKDISQAGIQVFGQTGTSKLAALRYLKLAEINNRDETVMLLDEKLPGINTRMKQTNRK